LIGRTERIYSVKSKRPEINRGVLILHFTATVALPVGVMDMTAMRAFFLSFLFGGFFRHPGGVLTVMMVGVDCVYFARTFTGHTFFFH